jgi:hypothetical protein
MDPQSIWLWIKIWFGAHELWGNDGKWMFIPKKMNVL